MTIKLPFILSAMIAALAIPGAYASEANTEETPTASAEPADAAEQPTAEAAEPKKKKMHHKHHHKHRHTSGGHTPDKWDAPFDQIKKDDNVGCGNPDDSSPKMPVEEVPGQKTP